MNCSKLTFQAGKVFLSVLLATGAFDVVSAQTCGESGHFDLVAPHEFDTTDVSNVNWPGFPFVHVGTAWDNLIDIYVIESNLDPLDGQYIFHDRIPNPHTIGTSGYCLNDADMDGMEDNWEIANGLDPNNAADASQDPDNDGISNVDEYRGNTDPNVSNMPTPMPVVSATFMYCGEPNGSAVWDVTFSTSIQVSVWTMDVTYDNGVNWIRTLAGQTSAFTCGGDSLNFRVGYIPATNSLPSEYDYVNLFRHCPSPDPGERREL